MTARVFQPVVGNDPARAVDAFRRIAGFIDDPIAHCSHVAGTENANVVRVTMQVRDRLEVPWAGRWVVLVYVTATDTGDPVNIQATVFATGTVILEVVADQCWVMLTDAAGLLALDITIAGTATRFMKSIVVGKAESKAVFWT